MVHPCQPGHDSHAAPTHGASANRSRASDGSRAPTALRSCPRGGATVDPAGNPEAPAWRNLEDARQAAGRRVADVRRGAGRKRRGLERSRGDWRFQRRRGSRRARAPLRIKGDCGPDPAKREHPARIGWRARLRQQRWPISSAWTRSSARASSTARSRRGKGPDAERDSLPSRRCAPRGLSKL